MLRDQLVDYLIYVRICHLYPLKIWPPKSFTFRRPCIESALKLLWTISLDHAVAFLGICLHWTTQRLRTAPKKGNGWRLGPRTKNTQWRHKSKKYENLVRCGRQNWEWELVFSRAVKAISSPGVRSPWLGQKMLKN